MLQTRMNTKVTTVDRTEVGSWDIMEHHEGSSGGSTVRGKLDPGLAVNTTMCAR